MKSTITRMILAIVIVSLIAAGTWGFRGVISAQSGKLPSWKANDFPMEIGGWKGKDENLSKELFAATGAEEVVNRNYVGVNGDAVALHMALFTNYDHAMLHQPTICYAANGWRETKTFAMYITDADGKEVELYGGKWELDGKTKLMTYWYQFGDRLVFNRLDMGFARLQMRGVEVWPALTKVLLDFPIRAGMDEKKQLQQFAQETYNWIEEADRPEAAEGDTPR